MRRPSTSNTLRGTELDQSGLDGMSRVRVVDGDGASSLPRCAAVGYVWSASNITIEDYARP